MPAAQDRKKKILEENIEKLWKDYEDTISQSMAALDASSQNRLKRQADAIYKNIEEIESELKSLSPAPAKGNSDDSTQNRQNLASEISDLQKQWELLNEKLNVLQKQRILETRSEEKFRLKHLIEETQTERDEIDRKLELLQDRLVKTNVPFVRPKADGETNKKFTYDVFLSYSSADKVVVRQLAERLRDDGVRVWFDEWSIEPGQGIFDEVSKGIERSKVLVQMMSSNGFGSKWAQMERETILHQDPNNHQRRFIPLLLSDCEIPKVLERFAYIDYRQQDDEAYKRLLAALHRVMELLQDK